jgi:hypothetical protein
MTSLLALLMIFGALLLPMPASAEQQVDLELVLALDASSSVDAREYQLQLEGIAAALRDPVVHAAIAGGRHGRIALNVMIWARPSDNKQTTGWRVIATPEEAERFARDIATLQRLQGGGTGIGEGIRSALFQLRISGLHSPRRLIDVSGDGRENFVKLDGMPNPITLPEAQALAERMGVSINGLAVTDEDPGLYEYYEQEVRHGPGSFVIAAEDYSDFVRAMKLKLLREISGQPVAMK